MPMAANEYADQVKTAQGQFEEAFVTISQRVAGFETYAAASHDAEFEQTRRSLQDGL